MAIDTEHDDLQKKALGRVELLVALIHIAILRYVLPKKIPDVSEAVHTLLSRDIKPQLNPRILSNPNTFRTRACYRRETDSVLRASENTLRLLFTAVCILGGLDHGLTL